ncbi:MAG: FAD-dependent oxidoreductase [Alphaproteobacteria bacterium]|nr:FAD-dependent oxidoreductase [Alphaproteobacteria bacterium]
MTTEEQLEIVVLGAGFAGTECANRLHRVLGRRAHVVLADQMNYMVFHPLLPEVAAGTIHAQHVINPIRSLCPGVDFDCADIESIDLANRVVHFKATDLSAPPSRRYDHLVVAMGLVPNMGIVPGMSAHGLPMKTVGDAFAVRNQVLGNLEHAANTTDPALRRELLTIVTVGAGFSGVETCAEVHDLATFSLRYFPELANERIHSVLVSATPRILPALSETASAHAQKALEHRNVVVKLSCRAKSVTPTAIFLGDGDEIPTRTVVGTIGNRPHPVIIQSGLDHDRGRLTVDAFMRCTGHENVWGIGDCALITNALDGELAPPTAQFASREGAQCADNVIAAIDGKELKPFSFKPKGYAASLGHMDAIVESGRLRFTGFFGWLVWRFMYLTILPGWLRRARVLVDWVFDLVFPRDICQLMPGTSDRIGSQHYQPGQTVVEEGADGDAFFLIETGEVEIVQRRAGGEQVLARLGPGAHFGEESLLTGARRNATVRAVQPTDVRVVTREDFALLTSRVGGLSNLLRQVKPTPEAGDEARERKRHDALRQDTARTRMRPPPTTVPDDSPVDAVLEALEAAGGQPVAVSNGAAFAGWIDPAVLIDAPQTALEGRTAGALAARAPCCAPEDDLTEIAERFYREDLRWMAVVEDGALLGMLTPIDVARARLTAERAAS